MQGTILLLKPREMQPIEQKITGLLTVESMVKLQQMVGGSLEVVSDFDTIEYEGQVRRCVAVCNKDGKHLLMNTYATLLWNHARRRKGRPPIPTFSPGR